MKMKIRYGSIGRRIMIIDKYFKLFLKDSLKKYGLNSAEGLVLLVLYGEDGKTQEQLIDELQFDKGVMTRTMKELEKKEYVTREKNALDNRSFLFFLTDKAVVFKETLIAILKEWNDIILQDIDGSLLEQVDSVLDIISENAMNRVR